MSTLTNTTVLITGGAAGIGKLMGKIALEKGAANLIIWDINQAALDQTVKELHTFTPNVVGFCLDVAHTPTVIETAHKVKDQIGTVDILINNAGIVVGKEFRDHSHRDIDATMAINAAALMHITLEFLPGMVQQGHGHIVNIASAGGMLANPKMSVYCASKWAVIGWSDSLRIELERTHPGIHVTTVTPYYIDTGMFAGVKSCFLLPILRPEPTVRKIMRGIERNRIFVRIPLLIYLLPALTGLLPVRVFDIVVGRVLGIYHTMDNFAGQKSRQGGAADF